MNKLMTSRYSSSLLLLCLCVYLTRSEGLVISHNVTAFVGQLAKLICTKSPNAQYPVDWHHRPVGSDIKIHIYSERGGGFRSEYKEALDAINNNVEGIYQLIIRNVSTWIAGTYYCVDNDEYSTTAAADLVVIDQQPSCRSNVTIALGENDCGLEPDEIQLTCDVSYHGAIPPQLKWLDMYGNDIDADLKSSSMVLNPRTLTFNTNMQATKIRNSSRYVCSIVQSVQTNCITTEIKKIEWKSSVIPLMKDTDVVNCTSTKAGSCRNLRWSNGTHVINRGDIVFNEAKYNYKCLADCAVTNNRSGNCTLYKFQYFQVTTESAEASESTIAIVLASIFAMVTCVIVTLLVIFRSKIFACCKEKNAKRFDDATMCTARSETNSQGEEKPQGTSTQENQNVFSLPSSSQLGDISETEQMTTSHIMDDNTEPPAGSNATTPLLQSGSQHVNGNFEHSIDYRGTELKNGMSFSSNCHPQNGVSGDDSEVDPMTSSIHGDIEMSTEPSIQVDDETLASNATIRNEENGEDNPQDEIPKLQSPPKVKEDGNSTGADKPPQETHDEASHKSPEMNEVADVNETRIPLIERQTAGVSNISTPESKATGTEDTDEGVIYSPNVKNVKSYASNWNKQ